MWLFYLLIWFAIGCMTYWYLQTRIEKEDIMVRDLGKMTLCGIFGPIALIGISFIIMHDKPIFKAKKTDES